MRRNNIAIMIDILETISVKEAAKTRIVYSANLNFKRADQYLKLLHSMGLIEHSSKTYHITGKGKEYLKKVREINAIFGVKSS